LPKLKQAIERFSNNTQIFKLAYDQTWKGIVSTAPSGGDFGNTHYNDHHFHYGYHVLAAAITAKVDREQGGSWINGIKNWVNNLARDFASPSDDDPYFPAYRSFDWYNGHSWAKGVYVSGDGKDQESSSEDYNAYYALKIWGNVVGDQSLENRSNIQLGVLRVSVNKYFLLADDNDVQPKNFIKEKVTGILFENKIDHTTYFGNNLEYIQMIHAIPITSISSFFRTPTFVREEWDQIMRVVAESITSGWKGISYLNLALTDPNSSWDFFAGQNFNNQFLDDGQTKTWSLAYSGAFCSV
jgi:endo-1,3(4)-beta-glucanase